MDANTARELRQVEPAPQQEQQPNLHPVQRKVPASKFEVLLGIVCTAIVAWMVVSVISLKITLTNHQQQLQQVQTKIIKINGSNTSIQQEIAEVTSQSNLQRIAHKYGLTDANSSVRNVNK